VRPPVERPPALAAVQPTPRVSGRFLQVGGEKQYVRGVTYGTFCDGPDGSPYPDPATVARDFAAMGAAGANAVRLYTPPPRWLLDLAHEHRLSAMVGPPGKSTSPSSTTGERLPECSSR
jgi:hypothetical protein